MCYYNSTIYNESELTNLCEIVLGVEVFCWWWTGVDYRDIELLLLDCGIVSCVYWLLLLDLVVLSDF